MWTSFYDMHSGGKLKTKWGLIMIEAPVSTATRIFNRYFLTDPSYVTCECCGPDFAVREVENRNYDAYVAQLSDTNDVMVIARKDWDHD